ncbi:MAG: hypothetical protein EZS28_011032 [Streblomastix strix]|uniref:Uncharacterized protein n=1 Tax=Streblomastix strix TaxID=222440 RepID=A0A5J4WES7_9EUKA|nr:MAG: hypothetical protein EZS28_011032 [Streblomastix strix]
MRVLYNTTLPMQQQFCLYAGIGVLTLPDEGAVAQPCYDALYMDYYYIDYYYCNDYNKLVYGDKKEARDTIGGGGGDCVPLLFQKYSQFCVYERLWPQCVYDLVQSLDEAQDWPLGVYGLVQEVVDSQLDDKTDLSGIVTDLSGIVIVSVILDEVECNFLSGGGDGSGYECCFQWDLEVELVIEVVLVMEVELVLFNDGLYIGGDLFCLTDKSISGNSQVKVQGVLSYTD